MTIDPIAQTLHVKSCRGDPLTPEEHARLKLWYAKIDEEEAEILAKSEVPIHDLERLERMRDWLTEEIMATAKEIRSQQATNERIRVEIEQLKEQLVQQSNRQPA